MGIPQKKKQIGVWLDPEGEIYRNLKVVAQKENKKIGQLARELIVEGLKNKCLRN